MKPLTYSTPMISPGLICVCPQQSSWTYDVHPAVQRWFKQPGYLSLVSFSSGQIGRSRRAGEVWRIRRVRKQPYTPRLAFRHPSSCTKEGCRTVLGVCICTSPSLRKSTVCCCCVCPPRVIIISHDKDGERLVRKQPERWLQLVFRTISKDLSFQWRRIHQSCRSVSVSDTKTQSVVQYIHGRRRFSAKTHLS